MYLPQLTAGHILTGVTLLFAVNWLGGILPVIGRREFWFFTHIQKHYPLSSPLYPYDIAMVAVLIVSLVFGLWKGMAWQLAALASLVLSAGAAVHFSGPLAPHIGLQAPLNRWVAMLMIYAVTALLIWILFRTVSGMIERVKLKEFDRQMGGVIGLAKGVLWCLVITFFSVTLSEPMRKAVLHSYSGYYIAVLIHRAEPIIPPEISDFLGEYIKKLDEGLGHDENGDGDHGHKRPGEIDSSPGESPPE